MLQSKGSQSSTASPQSTAKDGSTSRAVTAAATSNITSQTARVDNSTSSHRGGPPGVQFTGQAVMTGGIVAGGNLTVTNNHYHGPASNSATNQGNTQKTVNFHAIHLENVEKRTDGTLDWFTESEDYQAWKFGGCRIVWGTGIPGAGKTVLASRIIDDLCQFKATSTKKICVVFAYCRYSEQLTVKDILEALIKQFIAADPSLTTLAESLYEKHRKQKTRPTQRELLDLVRQMESRFDIVFYVIDGLDEARVETQFDLILAINALRGQFALTSRPLQTLQSGLPTTKFYSVKAHKSDIVRLVVQKIKRNPGFYSLLQRHSYLDELVQSIADKSNGMFLHAALQIEFVQHCRTIVKLKDVLQRFPAKIEDLYVETMKRINEQEQPTADLANHVLLWLVFGQGALTFPDLQHALRLTLPDHDGEVHKHDLLSVCCGLVTVEENTNLVRLVHYTAHESLPPVLKRYLQEPHGLLFKATTRRLIECGVVANQKGFSRWYYVQEGLAREPLLKYSYDHWAYHARESMANPIYADAVRQFVCQCTSFPSVFDSELAILSPLHVAARYGFHEILHAVLMETAEGNVTLRTGGDVDLTALMLASRHGHAETVDALLGYSRPSRLKTVFGGRGRPRIHVPKDHVNLRDDDGRTALIHAASNGREGTVERLLAHKDTKVNIGDSDGWTALIYAAWKGSKHTVERLLAHKDTKVNIGDRDGWTALIYAAEGGGEGTVARLLAHQRTDVNITDGKGDTALIVASRRGFPEVVRLLLQYNGIDVSRKNKKGHTALMVAQEEMRDSWKRDRYAEVVKLLTEFEQRSASSSNT
ncbi:ankyrin repeat domain-containing protein 50, variant 2 [Coprinopsis cinerea AmutBmut pab1-1]|nr:ankyrin repeat domain-containing protein 50, variant 2 [Coprinopsis cinerea AmutBmut pab1-1]